MRRSLIALVVAVVLLACTPMRADELANARFADYVEALRLQLGIPGIAAAIVGRTDVLWERGFGYQDVSRAVPMRPDTPMHLDGITQVVTASMLLRCAEENRLSLDDPIGNYIDDAPEPGATFRQLLSHTSFLDTGFGFAYRPERLDPLASVVRRCEGATYRAATAALLDRMAMVNSVPGRDVLAFLSPPAPGEADTERAHYADILERLTISYAVDSQRRVSPSPEVPSTLTASTGLISTARDYAQFDIALRSGILVQPETLADAWAPPLDGTGEPLPHGLGWFVQTYDSDTVVWQFGIGGENGSSSLVITLPGRGLTLVLLANSTGLAKSFAFEKGDLTTSPFARVFLSLFTR